MDELGYEPRYLAGIVLFNRADYFEAHEVWESLWMETPAPEKRYFQALIQAAVALCHFCNGNLRGALKLYKSSKDYMQKFASPHLGLDQVEFWRQMELCFAEVLAAPTVDRGIEPKEELLPQITLAPAPDAWPSPEQFLEGQAHE